MERVKTLDAKAAEQERIIWDLRHQNEEASTSLLALEKKNIDLKKLVTDFTNVTEEEKVSLQALAEQNAALKKTIETLTEEIQVLKGEGKRISQLENTSKDLDEVKKELQVLLHRKEEENKTIQTLSKAKKDIQEELSGLKEEQIKWHATLFSRRAADEVRGDELCTPDLLSPREESGDSTDRGGGEVERLRVQLEREQERVSEAMEGRIRAEKDLNTALLEQEELRARMMMHRSELQQRIVEQLDELSKQVCATLFSRFADWRIS